MDKYLKDVWVLLAMCWTWLTYTSIVVFIQYVNVLELAYNLLKYNVYFNIALIWFWFLSLDY